MKQLLLLNFFLISAHSSIFAQLWQNDFSNSSEWLSADLNGGSDTWIISSTAIGGSVDTINSTSAGNGFAQFNSEGQCAALHQDVTLTYFQQIDISTYELSYLEFVQHYQRKSDSVYVEFSNDGLTWESVRINQEYWYYQQTENPDTVQVSIPSTVHNAPFWLRFRYEGECGFAWLMDDLKIFEKEQYAAKTKTTILNNGLEYHKANHCVKDTVEFKVIIENFGYSALTNVVVSYSFTDWIGSTIVLSDTIPFVPSEATLDTTFKYSNDNSSLAHPNFEIAAKIYNDNLDTIFTYNQLNFIAEYFERDNEVVEGILVTNDQIYGVGNTFIVANDQTYCETNCFVYIPPNNFSSQLIYMVWYKKQGNNWIYTGQSDDYIINPSSVGYWAGLNMHADTYLPGDTALVAISGYGTSLPIAYAQQTAENDVYVINNLFEPIIDGEGHLPLIRMGTTYLNYCDCNIGIREIVKPDVSIVPNPSADKIQLQNLTQPIQTLLIYSIDGREVYSETQPDSESISISNLQSGTYLVVVELQDGSTLQAKFVKN